MSHMIVANATELPDHLKPFWDMLSIHGDPELPRSKRDIVSAVHSVCDNHVFIRNGYGIYGFFRKDLLVCGELLLPSYEGAPLFIRNAEGIRVIAPCDMPEYKIKGDE